MNEWFTLAELARLHLPELPDDPSGLYRLSKEEDWRSRSGQSRRRNKTGGGWEYHYSLLPKPAQTRLLIIHSAPANDDEDQARKKSEQLWRHFERLSKNQKKVCEDRLNVLNLIAELMSCGMLESAAVDRAACKSGVSIATIYNWRVLVQNVERTDWLAALAPRHNSVSDFADIHPDAWEALKSDYLRPERPSFSACFRRVGMAAKQHGWAPILSERAVRRRLEAEVPKAVRVLARDGKDKAKALYPPQRRTRSHLHAMQAVNIDGHKVDVFVSMPNGDITRLFLLALQDLYSGKFVAWRLSDSENKETTRLLIGDMVERFGIPERMTLDNGRAFSSKWITGGVGNCYRFKVNDEDPNGLLVTLGVEISWTKPYSGQSKPIERAFLDLTDNIARHPVCAGAYTGNKPDAKPENYASRAVPLDVFRVHVDRQMEEHNARVGRTGGNCNGRSFDQTFADSIADPATVVRWPSAAQRSLWLLATEAFKARKGNGEIQLYGNRYWHPALTGYAGKKVIIRFDPDHLTRDLKVYDLKNSLICDAPCISDTGFHDAEAARVHERARSTYQKAMSAEKKAHAQLTAQQLADIYAKGQSEKPSTPLSIQPRVTRLVTGNLAVKEMPVNAISQEQHEDNFTRALSRISGDGTILEFPKGNEPKSSAYGSKKRGGRNPAF
nr:MAG TPA: transposase [Caudoviricetes sp.]